MKHLLFVLYFFSTTLLFSQSISSYEIPSKKQLDSLKNELELILKKDQNFRRIHVQASEALGDDSFELEYFWEVVEAQDKVLEKQVADIIDKFGWLGISQVGRRANTALWVVIQHGSLESKEKYAPLLKKSVLRNESQGLHYARLIDKMLINQNKPQIYGTQINYDSEPRVFFDIIEPEFVDKRREEIGLNAIKEYAASSGAVWKIDQEK